MTMKDALWDGEWARVAVAARVEMARIEAGGAPGDAREYLRTVEVLANILTHFDRFPDTSDVFGPLEET